MESLGVYALLFTAAVNAATTLMLLPVLPFFAASLGASPFESTLVISVNAFAGMIGTPLLGLLADRSGRKPVMLAGLAAAGALHLALAFADTVPKLLLVRAALGVACATRPAENAYIADGVVDKKLRAELLGRLTTVCNAGQLLGPAVGGYLSLYGFAFMCRVMAGAYLASFLLGALLWEEPARATVDKRKLSSKARCYVACTFLSDPAIALLLLAQGCKSFGWAMSEGPEMFFLRDYYNFREKDLAMLFTAFSVASMLGGALAPTAINHLGEKRCCLAASLGCSAVMLSLVLVRTSWEPYLCFGGVGGCLNTIWSVANVALVAEACPVGSRGAVFGMTYAMKNAGFFIGPLLGGAAYTVHNFAPYVWAAGTFVVAALFYYNVKPVAPNDESFWGSYISGAGKQNAFDCL